MYKLKLAIIGCGAIAQQMHVPLCALSDRVDLTALVDKSLPRAHQLAENYNVPVVADDFREILGKVDAAIVALPHYLHASVTSFLLQNGIHVLVEKPMALKIKECDEMVKAASRAGAVLAVGLVCRFYEASQFVKQVIESDFLGKVESFDLRQGSIYKWTPADNLMFQKETGGGVLTGIGVHGLDRLLWWLGDYKSIEYYDDAFGGVEADCELQLRLQSGVAGFVEFSRTRNLRNTFIIHGERGMLEIGTDPNPLIRLTTRNNQNVVLSGRVILGSTTNVTLRDNFSGQFDNFVDSILSDRKPFIPGEEGRRVVQLIEACYASRQPLMYPWMLLKTADHKAKA